MLRNPGLSWEKAASSGAKMVRPPDLMVMSCEVSWLINCVVFMSLMNVLKDPPLVRIPRMSTAEVGGGGFDCCGGAPIGERAAKVVEHMREDISTSANGFDKSSGAGVFSLSDLGAGAEAGAVEDTKEYEGIKTLSTRYIAN
ncbi:hypothetical protein Ahy_B08g094101 isoform B [Arachis hypogaea]|uniref:Uncharacterized protein n=1 Tax=Arachis hypogaea TaxID=3818 RepID=A0A444Y7W0_ARAHY|nr:hypothetical protein Ahy_B08g094101 isoform B [Arachis hypogaea]